MAVGERDPHSGYMTTGHEWNGIKELNTPVPRVVWVFLILAVLFSIVYWVLMPAWPLGMTYTRGLLGTDQRHVVTRKLEKAAIDRAAWTQKIAAMGYSAIAADPALMAIVRDDGQRLFQDNCAVCHGAEATGGKGFPNLVDRDWIWGGEPDTVAQTIRVGINSGDKDGRVSQMLAFGRDGMLKPDEVTNVAHYVLSLSHPVARQDMAAVKAGQTLFAANCVVCHGADGRGSRAVGAPNLTDDAWVYGGDYDSVVASIYDGRQGQMPAWRHRLNPVDLKIVTMYVLDRGSQHR